MTYLPLPVVHDTQFPKAVSKDLSTQLRLIEQLYRRCYPPLSYHQLNAPATPAQEPALAGEAGATKYDPIYREAMDPALTGWEQPHLNPGKIASNPEQHFPPVPVNMRVQRVDQERDLKKEGVTNVRYLEIYIPCSILDALGITCVMSDYIEWNGYSYWVTKPEPYGYWKNTNLFLYVKLSCETKAAGS